MNKISISRILSILSVVSIPCNAFIILGIMIGGGFSVIDPRGFLFWGIVLIFCISIAFTILSWIIIRRKSVSTLFFSLLALLFCTLPLIVTLVLDKYNTQAWSEQKIQLLQNSQE